MLLCVFSYVDLFENYECVLRNQVYIPVCFYAGIHVWICLRIMSVHTRMLVCVYVHVFRNTDCVSSALPVPVCSGVGVEQAGTLWWGHILRFHSVADGMCCQQTASAQVNKTQEPCCLGGLTELPVFLCSHLIHLGRWQKWAFHNSFHQQTHPIHCDSHFYSEQYGWYSKLHLEKAKKKKKNFNLNFVVCFYFVFLPSPNAV